MAKQRDPVLDSMRGIGIVLMVLGHSGFPGTGFIYLFHMALFFMLSGWLFSLRGELVHFAKRKVVTLWLPFVLTNTAFTVLNNLFLRLNILTGDERILALPGNIVTTPTTLKDVIGRTAHWCVFDGGTQLGGALWFIQALFQISILYAVVEFLLQKLLRGGDTLIAQGLVSGVLLWVGWRCGLAGWNVWGLGIAASCYSLFYLGLCCAAPPAATLNRCTAPGWLLPRLCCWPCWGSLAPLAWRATATQGRSSCWPPVWRAGCWCGRLRVWRRRGQNSAPCWPTWAAPQCPLSFCIS